MLRSSTAECCSCSRNHGEEIGVCVLQVEPVSPHAFLLFPLMWTPSFLSTFFVVFPALFFLVTCKQRHSTTGYYRKPEIFLIKRSKVKL